MREYNDILNEMKEKYNELSGAEAYENSDIGLRLRVMAGELYALYARLDYIEKQSFLESATGEYLERHASEYGLSRRGASKAKGDITFYISEPLDYILNIPKGVVVAAGDSLRFITTEATVVSPGSLKATAAAEAEEGGVEYNTAPGTVNTIVNAPSIIASATNKEAFKGGSEIESDEKLRERLIEFISFLPNGVNEEYYKNLIYSISGVGSAFVTSSEAGKVDVYIWGKGEAASNDLINEVLHLLNQKKPVGTTVTVQNASVYNYDLYMDVTPDGCSFDNARLAVIEAAERYFGNLNIGDPVYKGTFGAYLLENAPIKNYRFPSAVNDFQGGSAVIPVLNVAEVGEI